MKKFVAILMALILALINVAALAVDEVTETVAPSSLAAPTAAQDVTLQKTIVKTESDYYKVTPVLVVDFDVEYPVITNSTLTDVDADRYPVTIGTVTLSGVDTADLVISLPVYDRAGVFTYQITENFNGVDSETGDTIPVAGVTMATGLYLTVTVITEIDATTGAASLAIGGMALHQDDNGTDKKVGEIENKYASGALYLEKTVSGNMADASKAWEFVITFTAPSGQKVYSTIVNNSETSDAVETAGIVSDEQNATASKNTFAPGADGWSTMTLYAYLKHGEAIQLENIPEGVTYEIIETEANTDAYGQPYVTTDTGDNSGTFADATLAEAGFNNECEITPDTGITLETLPYVLIAMMTMAGAMMLVIRKREEY